MNGNLFMCYVTLSKFETFPAFTVKSNSILEDFPQNLISLEVFSQKTKIQAHALSFSEKVWKKSFLWKISLQNNVSNQQFVSEPKEDS